MKVTKIELYNFRQFYDKQVIEFSTGENNITLIEGNNGYGKTGLFRALIFGLYGNEYLPQDNKKGEIHLVNFKAIREKSDFITESKVIIFFEAGLKKYSLERTVTANNNHDEQIGKGKLNIIDENGNFDTRSIDNPDEIKMIIENIIGNDIKDFFFFDGEKIDTLAKTDSKVKKEIKNAIVKLLKIETIERASNLLNRFYTKEEKYIQKKAKDLNLEKILKEKENIEKEIENIEKEIEAKQIDLDYCNSEIKKNEIILQDNKNILELQKKISSENEQMMLIKNGIEKDLNYLKEDYFKYAHSLIAKENYYQTLVYLKQIQKDQPDNIPINLIEHILEEKKCICGRNLNDNTEILERFKKRMEQYKRSELSAFLDRLIPELEVYDAQASDKLTSLRNRLDDLSKENKKLTKRINIIESLNNEIKEESKTEKNLENIELQLEYLRDEKQQKKEEINTLHSKIKENTEKSKELETEFNQQLKQDEALKFEVNYLRKLNELKSNFESVFITYSDDMRNKLMKRTTEIFYKITDDSVINSISEIKINEKYELEVYNDFGEKMTYDVSEGQKHIIALSFITALASLAVVEKDNKIFPLFIDTPFARLDSEKRGALIKTLPNLTNQLILLLTDTELRDEEKLKFKATKKIGKWYELKQLNEDCTIIQEKSF